MAVESHPDVLRVCVCVSVLKLFRFYFQNIPNILGRNSILASAAYGNYTFSNLNKH